MNHKRTETCTTRLSEAEAAGLIRAAQRRQTTVSDLLHSLVVCLLDSEPAEEKRLPATSSLTFRA